MRDREACTIRKIRGDLQQHQVNVFLIPLSHGLLPGLKVPRPNVRSMWEAEVYKAILLQILNIELSLHTGYCQGHFALSGTLEHPPVLTCSPQLCTTCWGSSSGFMQMAAYQSYVSDKNKIYEVCLKKKKEEF